LNDILEQSEIDALLQAVDSGEVEEETTTGQVFTRHRRDLEGVEIRPYDFKRPERVSKDQMRSLQTLYENFARNFGASLSGLLRTIVEVRVANTEQMTYDEFIAGLPNPTSFNLISASPLEGMVCMEISPLIIYPIIDRLLGGSNQDLFIPQRPMTSIEHRLMGRIIERALASMREAWIGIKELNFKLEETESNPQLVQIVPPNEVVVVVGFEVKMANRAGTMNLCIPYAVIEPLVDDLDAQSWFSTTRRQGASEYMTLVSRQLDRARVHVQGILAETTITLNDLRQLAVGDVIVTDKTLTEPAVVAIEGRKKYLAKIGQHKQTRALQVMRPIEPADRV
jgi:flagellar motor switch protein FliM